MGTQGTLCTIGIFVLFFGFFLLILGNSKEKRLKFSDKTLQSKFTLAAVFLIPTGTLWLTIQFAVWRYRRGYCCEKEPDDGEVGTSLVNFDPSVGPSGQPRRISIYQENGERAIPGYYVTTRGDIIPLPGFNTANPSNPSNSTTSNEQPEFLVTATGRRVPVQNFNNPTISPRTTAPTTNSQSTENSSRAEETIGQPLTPGYYVTTRGYSIPLLSLNTANPSNSSNSTTSNDQPPGYDQLLHPPSYYESLEMQGHFCDT